MVRPLIIMETLNTMFKKIVNILIMLIYASTTSVVIIGALEDLLCRQLNVLTAMPLPMSWAMFWGLGMTVLIILGVSPSAA